MKLRTMRDVPTIQGLRNQATPITREQAVAEMARLEHELARLQRELDMWTANQNKTAERMQRVEQRLAALKGILNPGEAERRAGRAKDPDRPEDGGPGKGKSWRTVDFQY
jgi:chromosome segregation ATPase